MKRLLIFFIPIMLLFISCGKSKKELAQEDSIKVRIERDLKSMREYQEKKNSDNNDNDKSNNNSTKNKNNNIKIGTSADDVLAIKGKALGTKVVGKDDNGLIVEWIYSDVTYTMKRTSYSSPYKVAIIK